MVLRTAGVHDARVGGGEEQEMGTDGTGGRDDVGEGVDRKRWMAYGTGTARAGRLEAAGASSFQPPRACGAREPRGCGRGGEHSERESDRGLRPIGSVERDHQTKSFPRQVCRQIRGGDRHPPSRVFKSTMMDPRGRTLKLQVSLRRSCIERKIQKHAAVACLLAVWHSLIGYRGQWLTAAVISDR